LTCRRMPGTLYLKRRRATGTLEVADRIVRMPGVLASGIDIDAVRVVVAHVASDAAVRVIRHLVGTERGAVDDVDMRASARSNERRQRIGCPRQLVASADNELVTQVRRPVGAVAQRPAGKRSDADIRQ